MKRYISIMLLAGMLLGTVSCGKIENISDETEKQPVADEVKSETETETEPEVVPVEKCDYNGETFNIYAPEWGGYTDYFFSDGQNGDTMNDAIYDRTLKTEEQLGIDVTYLLQGSIADVYGTVFSAIQANEDLYQLVLTHCITGVGTMLTDGLLFDWNQVPNVNLTADYWNQNCNDQLSIYGRQFYAVSDYMILDPNCILFNKTMTENYQLEDPYTLVREGKWTVDKFMEMSEAVTLNNGDEVWDHNDQYGFACRADWMLASFFSASDVHLVEKNAGDEWELVFYNERAVELSEKMDTLFNGGNSAYAWIANSETEKSGYTLKMPSGQILFQLSPVRELNLYRDCDVDFGILPYPKLNEEQQNYTNNDWGGLMCMPISVLNTEMAGKACELLAYYSEDTTIPTYYDLMLGQKLLRDPASKEMLELIFDNVIYDPGLYFFDFGNTYSLFEVIKNTIINGESAITSYYKSKETAAQKEISGFCEKVRELSE